MPDDPIPQEHELIPSALPLVSQAAVLGPVPVEMWGPDGIERFPGMVLAISMVIDGQLGQVRLLWPVTHFLSVVNGAIEMIEQSGVPIPPLSDDNVHVVQAIDRNQMGSLIFERPVAKEPDLGDQT